MATSGRARAREQGYTVCRQADPWLAFPRVRCQHDNPLSVGRLGAEWLRERHRASRYRQRRQVHLDTHLATFDLLSLAYFYISPVDRGLDCVLSRVNLSYKLWHYFTFYGEFA